MGDVKPVTEGEVKPLRLSRLTKIVIKGPAWPAVKWPCTLPSGIYKARFRDKQGAYYESETHIFLNGGLVESGGIFLPDQHQGFQSAMLWVLGSGRVQRFPIADTNALEGQFQVAEPRSR